VFRSFQLRLTLFFAALFIAVQGIAYFAVRSAIVENIVERSRQQLARAYGSFNLEVDETSEILKSSAMILASDFGFRQAIATNDFMTVRSAVINLGSRMNADRIMLIGLDRTVLTDSGTATDAPRGDIVTLRPNGSAFSYPDLIETAEAEGQSVSFLVMDERLYQVVVTPILAPVPIAWIAIASEIQNSYAARLAGHVSASIDVSFAEEIEPGRWKLLASTLAPLATAELERALPGARIKNNPDPETLKIGNDEYATLLAPLPAPAAERKLVAVLQFSINSALRPFANMFQLLVAVTVGFLVLTLFGAAAIARRVTHPIRVLDEAAQRIESGKYTQKVSIRQRDEFGRLSDTFNRMMDGIAERELQIEYQAMHDGSTGLANRLAFERRLARAIEEAEKAGTFFSVYLVQVGRFAEINNTFGHDVGEQLIKELGDVLKRIIKRDDLVARHSSNMFALLLPGAGIASTNPIVQRILERIEEPIGVAGNAIDVTAWIGEACYPDHGTTPRMLLQRADTAIYSAKRDTGHYAVYNSDKDPHKPEHLSIMGELRHGIERGEFKLFYQPKIDLETETVVAAEALIRWFHPTRGLVPPDEFIPLAEQTGNIHKITAWVLDNAIKQLAAWNAKGMDLRLGVNLSARDLVGHKLADEIRQLLATYRVSADRLILEITESAVMTDPGQSLDVLTALHRMGLTLAVDDYGIGYSSMSYLRRLPIQEIKIDKSFVVKLATSPGDQIIVRSTIDLGHNLGLKVTAEGIEDLASLLFLKQLRCQTGQGYYAARPLTAADFETFYMSSRWSPLRDRPRPQTAGVA